MDVRPLTPCVGVEIFGVDLARSSPQETARRVRPLLLRHGVVVFRGQHSLDRTGQIALGANIGALERFPGGDPDNPEIVCIDHGIAAPPTENIWHSDMSFRAEPPMGAVLRAVQIPPSGGDTLFADMREAWRRLPEAVREAVRGLTAEHSVVKHAPAEIRDRLLATFAPVVHPITRIHPETGEEILYVNTAYTTRVIELSDKNSSALLDFLFREVSVPEIQCRVRWSPGTVVLWDNRSLQHYAVADYLPSRRIMDRVSMAGDAPFGCPSSSVAQSGITART